MVDSLYSICDKYVTIMNNFTNNILGKWEAKENSIGGKMKFQFNKDGNGYILLPINSSQFEHINWVINKNTLMIVQGGIEIVFKLKYLENDTLKLKMIKLGGARQFFEKTRTFYKHNL